MYIRSQDWIKQEKYVWVNLRETNHKHSPENQKY